ncbi:MAG: HD-GYP domain-containing protein [Oscillospiraceae bacterium]|jgi:HD-GYP domain-containing protein (c-di-GMP phosphodiesterase class II)|nr:HD-GYP domain-containing protein [Oscillospiraceae bacterium]
MRFISIEHAQEGMIVGRPLRGRNGETLLTPGTALKGTFIETIKRLRYSGLYIQDEFSEGIEVEDIITDDLRQNAVLAVRRLEADMVSGSSRGFGSQIEAFAGFIDDIIESVLSNKDTVMNLVDLKIFDQYTYQHSVNVCVLSSVIGVAMGLDRAQLFNLGMTAILHDLGKFFIDKELLNKPGRLTGEEFAVIKKHPEMGCDYLRRNCYYSSSIYIGVLQHHERYNGTGYPHGRSGSDIHIFGRIIAVADVYDAITSLRPYHEPVLPSEAHEYIMGNSGQHFDPDVAGVFIRKIAPFPEGVEVLLSNGLRGVVYKNYPEFMTRPLIKLLPIEGYTPKVEFIDLKDDSSLFNVTITKVFT